MTIRRILLVVLILIVIISIGINGFILASLTDRYFQTYLVDSYNAKIQEIIDYIDKSMETRESYSQMKARLESYISDPISQLTLYDLQGDVLIETSGGDMPHGPGMRGMMRHMMDDEEAYVESYEIEYEEGFVYLEITANSSIENSIVAREFKSSLIGNSVISIFIALIISITIGYLISNKMTKGMKDTAKYAQGIQFGNPEKIDKSNIIEIRQIRESLEELNTRLNLKQESRKELIDQLIHQSRTPLTIIKTHIEAMEDGVIEGNSEEMKVIYHEIDNISSVISNLTGMIDAQKETDELNLEDVDIYPLMKQIITGLRGQFNKKEISLNLNSKENITISTDKYKLSQVLYNLLTNAYKYTEEKGQVDVEYKEKDNKLLIRIEDNGIGISSDDQKRIFDAYFRSSNAIKTQGEGIGLYMVMENLKELNGTIEVESYLGKGSVFTLSLPL